MGNSRYDFKPEANATSKELIDDINRLKPISDGEIEKLLPDRTDQEQLKELIKAVNAETDKNRKMAVLTDRLGKVAVGVKDVAEKIIAGAIKFA